MDTDEVKVFLKYIYISIPFFEKVISALRNQDAIRYKYKKTTEHLNSKMW